MLRMEIALVLVLGFVAYMYDSAERTRTALHRTFSAPLAATLVHLVFDALTLYTVNHLDSVPKWLNDGLHRLFVGTMVLVVYLFYQYIAILVEEESGKPRKLDLVARVYLAIAEVGVLVLPVHYTVTPLGKLLRRNSRGRVLCERGRVPSFMRGSACHGRRKKHEAAAGFAGRR